MKFEGSIFLVGGTGTLGQEFLKAAQLNDWDCDITVYSRGWQKQYELKRYFPDVRFIVGDILNFDLLKASIAGHDLVIHMAAMKHVVEGEYNPLAVIETNVMGSQNVLQACADLRVPDVIGISTDKACKPVNAYGTSKMMMERLFQQYAEMFVDTRFHLVRYGNVFGSSGSFIHNWMNDIAEFGLVRSTNPEMTRFWLTAQDAMELIYNSLSEPTGCTLIPRAKAAKVGDIEQWLIPEGIEIDYIGVRPGEKMHECLLSDEEGYRTEQVFFDEYQVSPFYRLYPAYFPRSKAGFTPRFSSSTSIQLSKEEFLELSGLAGDELHADNHS